MILKSFTVTDSPFLKLNQLVFMVSSDIHLTFCLTFKKIFSLQTDNILMVSPAREDIKICDFGFCQEIDNSRHQYSKFGTPEFVAPEIVHQEPVTVATDIWYQIFVVCCKLW